MARGINTVGRSLGNSRNKGMSKNRHKNLTCNFCKLKGHIRRECLSLKEEERTNSNEKQKFAEADFAEDGYSSDALVLTNDKKLIRMDA